MRSPPSTRSRRVSITLDGAMKLRPEEPYTTTLGAAIVQDLVAA